MFTGIISHQGLFRGYRKGRSQLAVQAGALAASLRPGESLAVDGVCLSLASAERNELRFDLSRETLARTTLGGLRPGRRLNLELPLTLASPLGGHLVSGHVDAVGKVLRIVPGRAASFSHSQGVRRARRSQPDHR
jgi:riboflavin synthase